MLWHATHTSLFDFHASSKLEHLHFWIHFRAMAQDGVPVWFKRPGPTIREAQQIILNAGIRVKVKEKIAKVLRSRYLVTAGINIKPLIKYFAVPKGEDDIRMVYGATAKKLNDCVWVPTFWLPTTNSLVRAANEHSWMMDRDVWNMFLNYQLRRLVMPWG